MKCFSQLFDWYQRSHSQQPISNSRGNNHKKLSHFTSTGICLVVAMALQFSSTAVYAECSFRSFSSAEDDVIGAYIAYYGRPADPGGLGFWSGRRESEGSLDSIIQAFGESQEFDQRFGSLDNTTLVTNLYDQLFGRSPDTEGLNFYVTNIEDGTMTLQSASLNILFGVQNEDVTIVNNRKNVAKYYVSELEEQNATSLEPSGDTLASLIAGVTVDTATATSACASIDTLIADLIETNDPTTYSGSGQLDDTGGTITAGDASITIPEDSLLAPVSINIAEMELPADLPTGLTQVDDAVDIAIEETEQEVINAPLSITLGYNDTGLSDEKDLLVLHYDEETGYSPVRITDQDTEANTITFESRTFSPFVLAAIDAVLPTEFDSGFAANTNGWNINNFGSYFAPGGNCLGMSGYATWYFNNKNDNLRTKYTSDIARLVSIRAHMAQSQSWAIKNWREEQKLDASHLGRLMKAYMVMLNQPLILVLGTDNSPAHASIVYGYDANGFKFYDVNVMDTEQTVTFDGTSFGSYGTFNTFGYVAVNSLGRTEDFAGLTTQAVGGFTTSSDINLTSPEEDEEFNVREAQLQGTLSNSLNSLTKLYVEVKGVGRQIAVANGSFNDTVEISNGDNTLVLLAGVDIGSQSNWYQNAATLIRTVKGAIPVTNLLVTLTWDQAETDVDLYITEPEGETMWYGSTRTTNGLALDIDDTTGFGPEHGTLATGIESASSGTVLPGDYIVRVHYYSDDGLNVPATGKVTIVINEGEDNQEIAETNFSISTDNSSEDGPGNTGASWADIAIVDIVNGVIVTN